MAAQIIVADIVAGDAAEVERLCKDVQMCPPGRNSFSQHALPMQAARRLQQTGDLLQASLAFEAAALVSASTLWLTRNGHDLDSAQV